MPILRTNFNNKTQTIFKHKIVKSEAQAEHRLNRIQTLLKKLKAILLEQHKQLEGLCKESDTHKQMALKADDLTKRIEEFDKDLDILNKEIIDLEKKEFRTSKNLVTKKTRCLRKILHA